MDQEQTNGGTGGADKRGEADRVRAGRHRRAWEEMGQLGGDFVIAGRYKLGPLLGEGPMGTAWRAEDLRLEGWPVVLKMIPQALEGRKEAYRGVEGAVRAAMKLSHLNIAAVRGFEDAEGTPFAVMDYIDGKRLDAILAERGKLPADASMAVLGPVALALDYAHWLGVLHRDIRPGNVIVRKDRTPFVRDFGIEREIQAALLAGAGRRPNYGRLEYASPEYLQGKPPSPAQDVYSFAAMAYECLTGRPPFGPDQLEWQILNQEPMPLPEDVAGKPFREGIMAGLSKDPKARPKSCAGVLMGDLGRKCSGRVAGYCVSPRQEPDGTEEEKEEGAQDVQEAVAPRPERRSVAWKWVAGMVLAAAVGAGLGKGAWFWTVHGAGRGCAEKETDAVGVTARPEIPAPRRAAEEEAEKRAEEEQLAEARRAEEERMAAEKRFAEQKAAEDEAARLEAERARRAREESIRQANEELEETVYRLAPLAKTKAENTERMGYARGQGFGERLDEMKKNLGLGEAAMQGRNFGKAKDCFEASAMAADWCLENAPLREAAARARDAAMEAKAKADAMDGAHLALRSYRRGEAAFVSGEGKYGDSRFREAAAAWNNAANAYAVAEAEARAEKVYQGLEAARGAERRGVWDEVLVAADGVLALADGNPEASRLKREAYEKLHAGQTAEESNVRGMAAVEVVPENDDRGMTAGKTKRISLPGGATMEMVWCPPGTFRMGSPSGPIRGERGRGADETWHEVTLTEGFWLAKTEVTQKQWKSVMGNDPSGIKGNNLPVGNVSWEDCMEFCARTGMRLPTEAEWEYACRAGSTGPYAGTGRCQDMGWYGENSGEVAHPVGQKMPNAWGLHDMHGNAGEWCADWYQPQYPDGTVTDPRGAASGEKRIVRGGTWSAEARDCRSSSRSGLPARVCLEALGFRPAMSEPPEHGADMPVF